ncbi:MULTISPECIES: DotH/IcmK family type IV secretion protein [Achromobacter]|nr:DotH/IcmK family type IV secretion protein [Achromobacter xylosoxidans]
MDMVTTAVDQVAPLNPSEILKFRKSIDERQAAEVQPLRSDLIPVSVTYDIDLSPGARPQVVQVTPGQGALVNIIDREGNGWPVSSVKNYNEGAIKVERMGPSTLSIEGLSNHKIASVGVLLEGMSVAWSFTVIPAQVTTDVRVDLRLPSLSPGSVTKIGRASGLPTVGAKLDGYLYGGTPEGARRLEVTGVPGARAWQSPDGKLVLRIAGLVSSPAWYERMPAADGTAVYELPPTPIVAVATDDGVSHTVRIKGLQPTVAASDKAWRHQ